MSQTFHQHNTLGLQTIDSQLGTSIDFPYVDVILLGVSPYLATLLTMYMEGHSRLVKFMRMDHLRFNRDLILDTYDHLVVFNKKLYLLGWVGSNRLDFIAFLLFGLAKQGWETMFEIVLLGHLFSYKNVYSIFYKRVVWVRKKHVGKITYRLDNGGGICCCSIFLICFDIV